ncbi:MAG: hypothetical protein AABW73_02195 [Nanoarchaeota archaeon]
MVRIENPLAIASTFLVMGLFLLIIGYFIYRKPEKFIGIRFVRGVGGYNLSNKGFWKTYNQRYGKEKAIKYMKINGAILMILGIIMTVFGIIKFFI